MANKRFTTNPNYVLVKVVDTNPELSRLNLKLPTEIKDFLQEMAWRNRTSLTGYLVRLVRADMDAHPEWTETVDSLNK